MRSSLAFLLVAACGPDSPKMCAAPGIVADLGTIDTTGGQASESVDGTKKFFFVDLNDDAEPDVLQIELYPGIAGFAGGPVRPGTYDLGGAEIGFDTCGVCALLYENVSDVTGVPARYYMPLQGSFVLTQTEGRLTGELRDVLFRHVTIDFHDPDGTGPQTPSLDTNTVDDGCRVLLQRAPIDSPYPLPSPDAGSESDGGQ